MSQKGFSFIGIFIILGIIYGAYYLGSQNSNYLNHKREFTKNENNKITNSFYTVEYPYDFYIVYKSEDDVYFSNKKWEGETGFHPWVGVRIFHGDMPPRTTLKEWLDKAGSPYTWNEFGNSNIPCKSSKESLRKALDEVPYGGHDNKLAGDQCLFFAVRNVIQIELPNIKSDGVAGSPGRLEILEFDSSGSSGVGTEGTHTLIDGGGGVWEIFKTRTSLSAEDESMEQAYQLLKESFKLK